MAKTVNGYVKLQVPAGSANPSPPIGPALGQQGVNIMEFCKQFNAQTADKGDLIIPVLITVYSDRSFTFITMSARFHTSAADATICAPAATNFSSCRPDPSPACASTSTV